MPLDFMVGKDLVCGVATPTEGCERFAVFVVKV